MSNPNQVLAQRIALKFGELFLENQDLRLSLELAQARIAELEAPTPLRPATDLERVEAARQP